MKNEKTDYLLEKELKRLDPELHRSQEDTAKQTCLMRMTGESFVLSYETDEEKIAKALEKMAVKMQKTLDLCRKVINERTDYKLSQKKIVLVRIENDRIGR